MELKCSKCKLTKSSELFPFRKNRNRHDYYCYDCRNAKQREYNKNNRKHVNALNKARRVKMKSDLVQKFGSKCFDCGNSYPDYVYDFHHLDPTKKDYFPAYAINQLSFDKMNAELEKCVMLCSNCHRIRHHAPGSS